jgi:hypothetical protein
MSSNQQIGVGIQKTIYNKNSFDNVVDINFNQLAKSSASTTTLDPLNPEKTILEFFNDYDNLFLQIPLSGSDQSHLSLADRSLNYLGVSLEGLNEEINLLREENIELRNQILLLTQTDIGTQI